VQVSLSLDHSYGLYKYIKSPYNKWISSVAKWRRSNIWNCKY